MQPRWRYAAKKGADGIPNEASSLTRKNLPVISGGVCIWVLRSNHTAIAGHTGLTQSTIQSQCSVGCLEIEKQLHLGLTYCTLKKSEKLAVGKVCNIQ